MLSIQGLNKSFPLRQEPVLQDINLHLEEGEICIVLGSNGSGKSTLLKTILGEYEADSGTIYLGKELISNVPVHTRASLISSVVQDISRCIIPEMTLLENLVIGYLRGNNPSFNLYGSYESQIYEIVVELGCGLEKHLYTPIASLSGEQRKIIATLMAVISDTKLLLLDEHTSGLDRKIRLSLMKYTMRKIESLKITTLMVTNNFTDAVEYGDRIIILHRGMIALDISGNDKLSLSKDHLLRLFHSLEDQEGY